MSESRPRNGDGFRMLTGYCCSWSKTEIPFMLKVYMISKYSSDSMTPLW